MYKVARRWPRDIAITRAVTNSRQENNGVGAFVFYINKKYIQTKLANHFVLSVQDNEKKCHTNLIITLFCNTDCVRLGFFFNVSVLLSWYDWLETHYSHA